MKCIIRHDVANDEFTIIDVLATSRPSDRSHSLDAIMRDIAANKNDRDIQITIVNNIKVYVYERGKIYGKTLIYQYVIDSFYKKEFDKVLEEIEDRDEEEEE